MGVVGDGGVRRALSVRRRCGRRWGMQQTSVGGVCSVEGVTVTRLYEAESVAWEDLRSRPPSHYSSPYRHTVTVPSWPNCNANVFSCVQSGIANVPARQTSRLQSLLSRPAASSLPPKKDLSQPTQQSLMSVVFRKSFSFSASASNNKVPAQSVVDRNALDGLVFPHNSNCGVRLGHKAFQWREL